MKGERVDLRVWGGWAVRGNLNKGYSSLPPSISTLSFSSFQLIEVLLTILSRSFNSSEFTRLWSFSAWTFYSDSRQSVVRPHQYIFSSTKGTSQTWVKVQSGSQSFPTPPHATPSQEVGAGPLRLFCSRMFWGIRMKTARDLESEGFRSVLRVQYKIFYLRFWRLLFVNKRGL